MAEKTTCKICNRTFKDVVGLEQHNAAKHSELIKQTTQPSQSLFKAQKKILIFAVISVLVIGGIVWSITSAEKLPPIDMEGHIESNPPSHIMKEPMPIAIQKHMLEHAGGVEGGRGGIIVNYNCRQYVCEEGLIEKLEAFATKYNYVYVAPYKGMDAKIALTRLGEIKILEEYNEKEIEQFIN